jgi:Ras-related protein Rab-5C
MSASQNTIGPFKVAFVGPTGSGKTSIVNRFQEDLFSLCTDATVGATFVSQDVRTPHGIVSLQIWDTAGQEHYRSLGPMYTRGAVALVVVYDVSVEDSLDDAQRWCEQSRARDGDPSQAVYVVGNKIDLLSGAGSTDLGRDYADSIGAYFYPTSAKTGEGIQGLFQGIAEKLVQTPVQAGGSTSQSPSQTPAKSRVADAGTIDMSKLNNIEVKGHVRGDEM